MKLLKISHIQYFFLALMSIIAFVFALKISKTIMAPFVVATLISIACFPLHTWINKFIKSNFWTVVTLMLFIILSVGAIISIMVIQIHGFYEDFPNISGKIMNLVHIFENYLKTSFNIPLNVVKITKENGGEILTSGKNNSLSSIFGSLSGIFNYLIFIPIYVFLLLFYKSSITSYVKLWLERINIEAGPVTDEISTLVQNYLKGMLTVMLILGVVNSLGLFFLDVPYAFILGFMVALFSIIPYVGTLLGAFMVLCVSYFSQGSLLTLTYIVALFSIIQFLEGNFLTPKIVGKKVNLNPLVAILALLIGDQIWGIVGMIIALPVTSILLMISTHIRSSAFYAPKKPLLKDNTK